MILAGNEKWIKVWMNTNLVKTPRLTTELAALERLKINVSSFSRFLLIQSILDL